MKPERLTKQLEAVDGYYIRPELDYANSIVEMIQRYGKLEDIEDEFGISLTTLHKICKQGFVYFKNISGEIRQCELAYVDIYTRKIKLFLQYQPDYVFTTREFKDYGIIWASTKEELL